MMNRILLVEDDETLGNGIKKYLERKDFEVVLKTNYEDALEVLYDRWNLAILDQNLPDGSGIDLCRMIRKNGTRAVIFLTANDTKNDIIKGFENGCDDYISKPFDNDVLLGRINAVLRRSNSDDEEADLFKYNDLEIDFDKMNVSLGGETVRLSATEYKILELLVRNRGQVITRDILLDRIWDQDENFVDDNTVSVHIRRLRKKIEKDDKDPKYIITVFGIGYTFGE